jgi:sugar O-acyltransferase (sialic acid O-acetyltransferase NeuD family)
MEVLVPRVNANDDDATLVALHATPWQAVKAGDLLASLETTKASIDVEAEVAGFFYPAAKAGETIKVGVVLGWIFPEKSQPLLDAVQCKQPLAGANIIVSSKARGLMQARGLTESDFPGQSAISVRDVEAKSDRPRGLAALNDIVAGDDAVVIWGGGYQGQVVLDILSETGGRRAVAVIDRDLQKKDVMGVPVFRPSELEELRGRGLKNAHVCIGDAAAKMEVAGVLKAAGFQLINVIHPSAALSSRATLGENVFVGPQAVVGVAAEIGDLCQINNAASIAHHSKLERAVAVSDGARIGGMVQIGEGTLVGIGAVINSRIAVGRNCVLVSGITVYSNVPDGTVVRADGTRARARDF